jgi:hypothetical protein
VKVLPSDSPFLKTQLSKLIPLDTNVVVMHLGRGGVENGVLDPYNQGRVHQTLNVMASIETIRPRATVRILWTGGHNRQQDRTGNTPPISEARAAHDYAATLIDDEMLVEDQSTSTVENATRSREMVAADDTLVVVTDKLHYLARKVQFIFWLTYPRHRVVFVMLPKNPPGTDWLSRCKHLVSTITTVVGMVNVRRGDPDSIQKRQNRLQSITGH